VAWCRFQSTSAAVGTVRARLASST
jgi:hypothetical protein